MHVKIRDPQNLFPAFFTSRIRPLTLAAGEAECSVKSHPTAQWRGTSMQQRNEITGKHERL